VTNRTNRMGLFRSKHVVTEFS